MCLIRMKYRIIILIIIIIRLGNYHRILQTHHAHTHARTDARAHAHPRPSLFAVSVRTLFDAGETMADRRLIEINYARATLYAR